jgi:hypothetical protein
MRQMVNTILRQYGTAISISGTGGEQTVKGFFQPVRAKSWQSLVSQETPLGEMDRRQYIFIGSGELVLEEGDVLTVGQKRYCLRRTEKYFYADQAVYTWGMCVEKGGDGTWGA